MVAVKLNVLVDVATGPLPVSIEMDTSDDLKILLEHVVAQLKPFPTLNFSPIGARMYKPPPDVRWLLTSPDQQAIADADLSTWTELEQPADLIEHWFHPSFIDPKVNHLLFCKPPKHAAVLIDVGKILKQYYNLPSTSDLITIHVEAFQKWSEADVLNPSNAAKLQWRHVTSDSSKWAPLEAAQAKLDEIRSISDPELLERVQRSDLRDISPPIFQTTADTADGRVSLDEIKTFQTLEFNCPRWVSLVTDSSSHGKDGWFRSYFVSNPMFGLEEKPDLNNYYKFDSGVGWQSSLIIKSRNQPPRRFSPSLDFLVIPYVRPYSYQERHQLNRFYPILLGEIISVDTEIDRWRMLLELIICARFMGLVLSDSEPFVVQGVYVNKEFKAERYLAYADIQSNPGGLPTVYMSRDIFDVRTLDGGIRVLRSMYNFVDMASTADSRFRADCLPLCQALHTGLDGLASLSSKSAATQSAKVTGSLKERGTLSDESITEESVMAMGYMFSATSETHPHIAYASTSDNNYVLKLVTDSDELSVLQELHCVSATNNHIIPIHQFFSTDSGTIISMPSYTPLDVCRKLPVSTAAELCQQLLVALRYLHSRNIVHRDLKPENVVVDLESDVPQLFIIDFDLATFVDGRDDYLSGGPLGTEGFTAPEVGFGLKRRKEIIHSPMLADLWAGGNLIAHILTKSEDRDAPALKNLWTISWLLRHDSPSQRPSAEDVLAQLSLESPVDPSRAR